MRRPCARRRPLKPNPKPPALDVRAQMVMLGSGSAKYEAAMRAAEAAHRPSFRGWVGFSVPVAHRIVAACDVLLMPSRFEPCGLNQLFAMRYGTVPIAHATGGLRDTIRSYDPHATGARVPPRCVHAGRKTCSCAAERAESLGGSGREWCRTLPWLVWRMQWGRLGTSRKSKAMVRSAQHLCRSHVYC